MQDEPSGTCLYDTRREEPFYLPRIQCKFLKTVDLDYGMGRVAGMRLTYWETGLPSWPKGNSVVLAPPSSSRAGWVLLFILPSYPFYF